MNKKKRTRYIVIGIVAFIVLLIILKAAGVIGKKSGTEVEVSEVTTKTIIETVNASGKVQPEKEVKISADISGEIIELTVKEGDKVEKGDLLVRIKPDEFQRVVERARAGVNTALANLANSKASHEQSKASFERAKSVYERNKKLADEKVISEADFENIQVEYRVAKAQLEGAAQSVKAAEYNLASARATLNEAQDALRKTAVYAPMSGTISRLDVELGERVVGTMQMAGTEMMRLADLSNMEVEVEVNESDIVRLEMGDTANIEIDAYRGQIFKGRVTEIASSAKGDDLGMDKVTNFIVKIRLLESSYSHLLTDPEGLPTPFRPGMSATVAIQTQKEVNVLAVPVLAVTVRDIGQEDAKTAKEDDNVEEEEEEGPEGEGTEEAANISKGEIVVFVYKDGKVDMTPVKIGIQDDTYIHIKEGLEKGQKVASGPYHTVSKTLKDGKAVILKEKAKDADKD